MRNALSKINYIILSIGSILIITGYVLICINHIVSFFIRQGRILWLERHAHIRPKYQLNVGMSLDRKSVV